MLSAVGRQKIPSHGLKKIPLQQLSESLYRHR